MQTDDHSHTHTDSPVPTAVVLHHGENHSGSSSNDLEERLEKVNKITEWLFAPSRGGITGSDIIIPMMTAPLIYYATGSVGWSFGLPITSLLLNIVSEATPGEGTVDKVIKGLGLVMGAALPVYGIFNAPTNMGAFLTLAYTYASFHLFTPKLIDTVHQFSQYLTDHKLNAEYDAIIDTGMAVLYGGLAFAVAGPWAAVPFGLAWIAEMYMDASVHGKKYKKKDKNYETAKENNRIYNLWQGRLSLLGYGMSGMIATYNIFRMLSTPSEQLFDGPMGLEGMIVTFLAGGLLHAFSDADPALEKRRASALPRYNLSSGRSGWFSNWNWGRIGEKFSKYIPSFLKRDGTPNAPQVIELNEDYLIRLQEAYEDIENIEGFVAVVNEGIEEIAYASQDINSFADEYLEIVSDIRSRFMTFGIIQTHYQTLHGTEEKNSLGYDLDTALNNLRAFGDYVAKELGLTYTNIENLLQEWQQPEEIEPETLYEELCNGKKNPHETYLLANLFDNVEDIEDLIVGETLSREKSPYWQLPNEIKNTQRGRVYLFLQELAHENGSSVAAQYGLLRVLPKELEEFYDSVIATESSEIEPLMKPITEAYKITMGSEEYIAPFAEILHINEELYDFFKDADAVMLEIKETEKFNLTHQKVLDAYETFLPK